jgi:excisionase family DNA binding protein
MAEATEPQVKPLALKPAEAAAALGIRRGMIHKLIRENRLESTLIGRSRLVTMRSIEAMLYREAA